MRVVAKQIEVVSWFTQDGIPNPFKFRLKDDKKQWKTYKIEQIIDKDIERLAGNRIYVFICQSEIEGILRKFEIKFELDTCKWILFKM